MPQHQANSPAKAVARLRRDLRRRREIRRDGPYGSTGRAAERTILGDSSTGSVLSTLDATIRPVGNGRYRRLAWAPGEPHVVRDDLGVEPSPRRDGARRSLAYFAHHTDVHVCDAQSPARLVGGEAFGWVNPGADSGHRPQETCTTQVLDQLVRATNALRVSPLSGAEMQFCLQTGDNSDNRTVAEVAWWKAVLDGRPLTPDTGTRGRYEGVQRSGWRTVWHPDSPGDDVRQRSGFPVLPGFLDAAVAPFSPAGLDVPWLTVFGNHDQIFEGTFGEDRGLPIHLLEERLAGSSRNPVTAAALIREIALVSMRRSGRRRWPREPVGPGVIHATPDPEARRSLTIEDYLGALLVDEGGPGPVGHGFDNANLVANTSWWTRPVGDSVQLVGLDT